MNYTHDPEYQLAVAEYNRQRDALERAHLEAVNALRAELKRKVELIVTRLSQVETIHSQE